MKNLKQLKHLDLFSTSTEIFLTSRDHKKQYKKKFQASHGSIIGGIISIVFLVVTVWYIIELYANMMSGQNDNISFTESDFDKESNGEAILISNMSFIPYFEITPTFIEAKDEKQKIYQKQIKEVFDENELVNYTKLN